MMGTVCPNGVSKEIVGRRNVELRGGTDYLCGTCGPYRFRPMTQLFADISVPIIPLGSGTIEIGPHVKGTLLDSHIPQIAGGLLLGYRIGNYELLGHIGRGYATERIGETKLSRRLNLP